MPATTTGAPFSLNVPSTSSDLADLFGLYLVPNMSTLNTYAAHKGTAQTFSALQTFSAGLTVSAGTLTAAAGLIVSAGQVAVQATTVSSSTTTGALVVSGGVGIAGAVFTGSTASIGGALTVTTGGISVTGNSTITGTLGGLTGLTVSSGGASITGNSTIAGTLGSLTGLTLASGIVTLPLGTVSAPSFVPTGGTTTGQWFPSTASIAWSSGGTEVMRMTSTGLGIGQAPGSSLDVKGTLRLSGSSSGYVGLAPAAAAGSVTYTLPSADGAAGTVLSTNGAGTLSWAAGGGGSGTAAKAFLLGGM